MKYVRSKCNQGTKCHKVGLASMFSCDVMPLKGFQKGSSGVDKQSVHLETKRHSGCSETWDAALGGRFGGRFVKAQICIYICVTI
jgi:hypothetical protein